MRTRRCRPGARRCRSAPRCRARRAPRPPERRRQARRPRCRGSTRRRSAGSPVWCAARAAASG
ncbi:hypothetical protein E3T34_02875 [Cryobacterium sp. TMT1-62]|nr:hypothetical protein E3T34_02875 [Cryobacterium sp. TMT1-62]